MSLYTSNYSTNDTQTSVVTNLQQQLIKPPGARHTNASWILNALNIFHWNRMHYFDQVTDFLFVSDITPKLSIYTLC